MFLALAAVTGSSQSALASDAVRVRGAHIIVSDLVPDCPQNACDIEVARAPLPGRTAIVGKASVIRALEAAGVDAATVRIPTTKRVLRPSRRPSEQELRAKVESAVTQVLPGGARLVSLGSTPSIEAPLGEYEVQVKWSGSGAANRRVSFPVSLHSDGEEFARWQSSAEVIYETLMPVLVAQLPAGSVLREQDVEIRAIATPKPSAAVVTELSQLIGVRLRRNKGALEPILLTDVETIAIVHRGEALMVESVHGSIRITTNGVSREDGAVGARIRVVVGSSPKLLWAKVVAPGKAMVTP
jgi:flagella basal body P-ring formation protein FlgA